MPTTVVGGAKKPKTKKDMTCGVNPKTDRCKKGEPKGKDMCVLNKSTNRCKKDQHTEAKNYARIFKGGARATSPVRGGSARATSPVRGGSDAFNNCMNENYNPVKEAYLDARKGARKKFLRRQMTALQNDCILNNHPSSIIRCDTKKKNSHAVITETNDHLMIVKIE